MVIWKGKESRIISRKRGNCFDIIAQSKSIFGKKWIDSDILKSDLDKTQLLLMVEKINSII